MTVLEGCDEIVKEFLVESYENLDRLDQDLVALEQDPANREILASIFRTIHTIKGTCGFLAFGKLEKVAHVGENLLSKLRDGELALDAERTSALLWMIDGIRQMLASIETDGNEGEVDYDPLIGQLTLLQQADAAADPTSSAPAEPPAAEQEPAPEPTPASESEPQPPPQPAEATPAAPPAQPPALETRAEVENFGNILLAGGKITEEQLAVAARAQHEGDPRHIGEILVENGALDGHDVTDALKTQKQQQKVVASQSTSLSESTIRVDVEHLDKLMNLVGELVLARNQILQFTGTQEDAAFVATSQRLNLITTELQEGVMKTRMQPIGNVWSKLPRVVRDLARSCGKKVRIVMEGKQTELDKTIIEAIRDPLTHLVRNSVDHGFEESDERVRVGKDPEGTLQLRAYHEGGQVNIEIVDDGAGIDTDLLKDKAIEKAILTTDQAARMGERELLGLIFAPGFSTAKRVTNVSGRGVGMDVVRTNIEKIGGSIDLQSQRGRGTTIKIKIPLTLAIIPALIVTCENDLFAIPQVNLLELVRLEGESAVAGIEDIHGSPVYRLRGNLLPLVYLNDELRVRSHETRDDPAGASGDSEGAVSIVVLQADKQHFGLVVSEIKDTEEIVVKPLGRQIKDLETFAGATIMGDGKVALILDVVGLAQRAGVIGELSERGFAQAREDVEAKSGERQTLLVFSIGDGRRMAMPLDLVARLEEFPKSCVETTGDHAVVQYRGEIMPLASLAGFFGTQAREDEEKFQVVVYTHEGRSVGLVVEEILDIVKERISVKMENHAQPGILGAAVIQHRVTDLIDVAGVVRSTVESHFSSNCADPDTVGSGV